MLSRAVLGQIVRDAWVERAKSKAALRNEVPRPDHVAPYSGISQFDQETDNLIGEAVQDAVLREHYENDDLKFLLVLSGISFFGGAVITALVGAIMTTLP